MHTCFFCFGTVAIFVVFSDIQPIDFCYWVDLENHLLIVNTKNDLPIIFGIFFVCTLLIDEPLAYHPFRFSFRLNQIHWFFKHIFLKCQISHEGNTFCWILCSLRNFCVSSNISYSAQYFFPTRIWPWIRVLFLPWIWASSIFFPRMTCNDSLLFQQFYKSRWTCLSLTFLFSVNVLLPLYI